MRYLRVFFRLLRLVFGMTFLIISVVLSKFISPLNIKMKKSMVKLHEGTGLGLEDYFDSMFTFAHIKQAFIVRITDVFKTVLLGHEAPNSRVFSLKEREFKKILDYQKNGRPLILNFGSCS